MKWVIIIAGALVAIVLLVAIVGALLPRDHVAALSTRIAASPEAVWSAINDLSAQPLKVVVDESVPHTRLVTRIADTSLPFGGTWQYDLSPEGDGTRLTITERGSVYNPVFRFVSRFIMGHTATIETYLRALGRKFGDEPSPTVVAVTTTGAA